MRYNSNYRANYNYNDYNQNQNNFSNRKVKKVGVGKIFHDDKLDGYYVNLYFSDNRASREFVGYKLYDAKINLAEKKRRLESCGYIIEYSKTKQKIRKTVRTHNYLSATNSPYTSQRGYYKERY